MNRYQSYPYHLRGQRPADLSDLDLVEKAKPGVWTTAFRATLAMTAVVGLAALLNM